MKRRRIEGDGQRLPLMRRERWPEEMPSRRASSFCVMLSLLRRSHIASALSFTFLTGRLPGTFAPLSPNPPTRSGLGVGTRGEGRGTRRSALDSDKWGRWRPLVVVGDAYGGPGSGVGAGSAGQHAGEDNRGPGRCDSVGRLGSLVDGSGAVGAVRQAKAGLAIEPGRE